MPCAFVRRVRAAPSGLSIGMIASVRRESRSSVSGVFCVLPRCSRMSRSALVAVGSSPCICDQRRIVVGSEIKQASAIAHAKLTPKVLAEVIEQVPDAWLESIPGGLSATQRRAGYLNFFLRRLAASHIFEQEAIDGRSRLV